jgi:ABC-type multidrug transport system fused ATPase/permease subunit
MARGAGGPGSGRRRSGGLERRAGRVLVLSQGRIVEEGSHAQLLAAGGEYAALYRLQAAQYR